MADNDVQVKFGAQLDGLIAGVNEAKEVIGSVTEPIQEIQAAFSGIAEAIGAAFAIDKLEEFMGKFAEMGESVTRTAAITGLATDQVQLFNLAVKMSGGDAGTAAMTLNILQKNIGDAVSGAGTARTAFQNMGISLAQLKNTDVVDLLFQIKERMDEAGTSAEQSALKQDYLRTVAGRGAAGFLALKMSLEEVKKIAQETGVIMDPTMVAQADHLAESGKQLSAAWQGFGQNLASVIAPAYDAMIKKTASLIEATSGLFSILAASPKGSSPSIGLLSALAKLNTNPQRGGTSGSWGYGVNLGEGQFGPQQVKPLPGLDKKAGADDDGDKTAEQIDRNDYETSLEIQKLKLQNKKDADQAAVESGKLSAAQQIADLQQMAAQEYAIEIQAVDQLASTYDQDSAEYAALQNKKLVLAQQFANEQAKLTEQLAAEQKKQYEAELAPWKQLMGDMGSAFDTMIDGILTGQQTWKQALAKSYDDLAIKFAEIMAKMTAEYLAFEATSGKGILGFGTSNPFAALGGAGGGGQQTAQIANTLALTTLNTQIAALNTAMGISVAATAENTTITSATSAQGLAAWAENTIATAANTISTDALRLVELVKGFLPSFDVGSYSVPQDMIAQIHQGEMIVPAAQAAQIRSGSASLGGSAGGAGGAGGAFTININAIDTQTGAQFLKSNASVIAQTLAVQMRNGNNALTSAARN